jgi:hypothetical protein
MRALVLFTVTLVSLTAHAQHYTPARAHDDSMLIYRTYKDEISFLQKYAQESNIQGWYNRSAYDDSLTNCAKLRLKKWNNQAYQPIDERDLEGYGTAFLYPAPGELRRAKYSITDSQTKFITRADGKTKIPYIERTYFDEGGSVINVVHLNPTTLEGDGKEVLASASN